MFAAYLVHPHCGCVVAESVAVDGVLQVALVERRHRCVVALVYALDSQEETR
jgi:hypothetical protein